MVLQNYLIPSDSVAPWLVLSQPPRLPPTFSSNLLPLSYLRISTCPRPHHHPPPPSPPTTPPPPRFSLSPSQHHTVQKKEIPLPNVYYPPLPPHCKGGKKGFLFPFEEHKTDLFAEHGGARGSPHSTEG